jgi:hypothetical protein
VLSLFICIPSILALMEKKDPSQSLMPMALQLFRKKP